MIGTEAFDRFVSENRWAVITTVRKSGQPSSSVVAYAREGDTVVVSTTAPTLKVRTLERNPQVTITVFNDAAPFNFVTVEGRADIEREGWSTPPTSYSRTSRARASPSRRTCRPGSRLSDA